MKLMIILIAIFLIRQAFCLEAASIASQTPQMTLSHNTQGLFIELTKISQTSIDVDIIIGKDSFWLASPSAQAKISEKNLTEITNTNRIRINEQSPLRAFFDPHYYEYKYTYIPEVVRGDTELRFLSVFIQSLTITQREGVKQYSQYIHPSGPFPYNQTLYLINAHENERIHISLVLANNQTDSSSIQFYIVYHAMENTSLVWMNVLLILVSMTLVLVALLISLCLIKKYLQRILSRVFPHLSQQSDPLLNSFLENSPSSKEESSQTLWTRRGGTEGVWIRNYKSPESNAHKKFIFWYIYGIHPVLLWLPASSFPGINCYTLDTVYDLNELYQSNYAKKERWFEQALKSIQNPHKIRIILNRKNILLDTLLAFATLSENDLKKTIKLQFSGEAGIDAGGVTREWIYLLIKELFEGHVYKEPIFIYTWNGYLSPPNIKETDELSNLYIFTGKIIGRALLENVPIGIQLHPLMYILAKNGLKAILSLPIGLEDLSILNRTYLRSYMYTLESTDKELNDLELYFTYNDENKTENDLRATTQANKKTKESDPHSNEIQTIELVNEEPNNSLRNILHSSNESTSYIEEYELIEGGREIKVNTENRELYVLYQLRHLYFERYSYFIGCFLYGLFTVIPRDFLMIYTEEELKQKIQGNLYIDICDWRNHTVYTGEFFESHPTVIAFWNIVSQLSHEDQFRLLRFSTGYAAPPCGGFDYMKGPEGRYIPFCLSPIITNSMNQDSLVIKAHTCFHKLEIPICPEDTLKGIIQGTLEYEDVLYGFDEE